MINLTRLKVFRGWKSWHFSSKTTGDLPLLCHDDAVIFTHPNNLPGSDLLKLGTCTDIIYLTRSKLFLAGNLDTPPPLLPFKSVGWRNCALGSVPKVDSGGWHRGVILGVESELNGVHWPRILADLFFDRNLYHQLIWWCTRHQIFVIYFSFTSFFFATFAAQSSP